MSAPVYNAVPLSFASGDTLKLSRSTPDFSAADGWAYSLILAGPSTLTITGTANGSAWDVVVTAAQTGGLTLGVYQFLERVSKSGEVYTIGAGNVEVTRNLATASAGDALTHEAKTLTVIEAALSNRLTSDMESYQIAGRSITKIPILDLLKLKSIYAAKVQMQRFGVVGSQKVQVVFGDASSAVDGPYPYPMTARYPWA